MRHITDPVAGLVRERAGQTAVGNEGDAGRPMHAAVRKFAPFSIDGVAARQKFVDDKERDVRPGDLVLGEPS